MSRTVTFVIHAELGQTSLDLFQKAIDDIRRLIRDVDYAVTRQHGKRRWVIEELHSSAPTITLRPLVDSGEVAEVLVQGISGVTKGISDPPKHFNEPSLEDLRRMQRLFRGKDRATSLECRQDGQVEAAIGEDIGTQVEKILAGGYSALGAIEGTLEAINLHGGSPTFTIWDRVSGSPVRCSFPKTSEWKNGVEALLEKRVMVRGTVNYFKNGIPRSITTIRGILDETPDPKLPKADFGSLSSEKPIGDIVDFLKHVREGV